MSAFSPIAAFCLLLLTGPFLAREPDLAAVKRSTQVFERIVGEIVRQNFSHPLALAEEPRGAYLPGYGVVVSFNLNINRARIRTPFGEIPARNQGERPKQEQIQSLRDSLVRCLSDYGDTFKQLDGGEHISIHAHIEDRNELDPARKFTVLVVSAARGDVERLSRGQLSALEFEKRVSVTEY